MRRADAARRLAEEQPCQNTQDRDGAALHAKIDELLRSGPSKNRFLGIEKLTLDEICAMRDELEKLVEAKTGEDYPKGRRKS